MRIITWNCLGAFRRKAEHIAKFKPDLAIIQECERAEKLIFKDGFQPRVIQWYGDVGVPKGIGIFGYANLSIELAADYYDATIRHCIPLRVRGLYQFNLIAIWAMPHKGDRRLSYIGQVWQALNRYRSFIRERDTLLVGDFNSNKIFDRAREEGNHLRVVEILEQEGILSVYHEHFHAMRARIADILKLDIARISVKATTTEGLGFEGRREGLAAQAVATVRLP